MSAVAGRVRSGSARKAASAFAVALLVALVLGPLGVVVGPLGGLPSTAALGASTDLTVVTSASYRVQPTKARVVVTVDATATNHVPDTRVNRFYFDHAFLAVQPGVTGVKLVKGPKGAGVSVVSRTANATMLRISFGGRLYGGSSAGFRFSFSLVDTGTTAQRLIRIGTSLTTFPVWAYASDGASGSSAVVQFPQGYDVAVESGSFASRTVGSDGSVVLATGALANPLSFFAYVSAQQPATYRTTQLSVPVSDGTIALSMQAWQDDKTWAGRVGALFTKALPVLRTDIGLAWPHADPVVVQEAVSRSAGGYAGLYDPRAELIQVAYWAGSPVVIHEAAHGWFNGSLLADRWAVEGFASLYAQRALTTLKIKAAAPALTPALQAAAIPLNDWPANPEPGSPAESYGCAASYTLAGLIADRATPQVLARVWADAAAGIGAYQPPAGQGSTTSEKVDGPPDWRGLLDLLETETGSDFTDLWRTWVVRPDEAALLDQRAAARAAYQQLLGSADGWALPRSIRDALRAWRFDIATPLMTAATQVLTERAALEAQGASAGLALPSSVQRLFESGDLSGAVAEAQREEAAITAITTARADRASTSNDPLTTVGMLGQDPNRDLNAADAAFVAGDPAAAVSAAQSASVTWAAAHDEGRRRALMAISLAAAILVLVGSLASRLRRVRRPPMTVIAP